MLIGNLVGVIVIWVIILVRVSINVLSRVEIGIRLWWLGFINMWLICGIISFIKLIIFVVFIVILMFIVESRIIFFLSFCIGILRWCVFVFLSNKVLSVIEC